jgi:hypothetical protein
VAHIVIPRGGVERSQIQGQAEVSETLSQKQQQPKKPRTNKKPQKRAGGVSLVVEHLPSNCRDLGSIPSNTHTQPHQPHIDSVCGKHPEQTNPPDKK